mgnify:CR=1 FL=1
MKQDQSYVKKAQSETLLKQEFSITLNSTSPPSVIYCKENKKLALRSGIQTYQILTNNDEVCIPSLSSNL